MHNCVIGSRVMRDWPGRHWAGLGLMKNPFQFGRELAPPDLVDRQNEIATCVGTVQNRERLFLIGPRRYGKTSILKAASEN